MSLRIRKNGRIFCAELHPEEPGDTYIDDSLHYLLSVEKKLLVTESWEKHRIHGEWWWKGNVPSGVEIDKFYRPEVKAPKVEDGMEERSPLIKAQADQIEAEIRRLEADTSVGKQELRLFMQTLMPCGHAVGDLLTCPDEPWGCVQCNASAKGRDQCE